MATTYYPLLAVASGVSVSGYTYVRQLSDTQPGVGYNATSDTLGAADNLELFNTGSGGYTLWVTPPLAAQTLGAGTINVTMYGNESAMTTNGRFTLDIYILRGGSLTANYIFSGLDDVELGTTAAQMTFSSAFLTGIPELPIQAGDRLAARFGTKPIQGGSYGGGNTFMEYNSANTYIQFPWNLTESSGGTTHNGVASPSGVGTLSAVGTVSGVQLASATLAGVGTMSAIGNAYDGFLEGKGLILSGLNNTYTGTNVNDAVNFRTKTVAVASGALSAGVRTYATGVADRNKGYVAGGTLNAGNTADIDRVDMLTNATSNPSAALTQIRQSAAGVSSETKGYFAGGYNTDSLSDIDALTFSSEAVATISASLALARSGHCGAQSMTRGYFFGYNTGTEIDGLRFDTEAAINPSAGLVTGRANAAGVSSRTAGYVLGGYKYTTPYHLAVIDKFDFASESCAALTTTLTVARYHLAGISGTTHGLGCAGQNYSGAKQTTVDGVDFFSDTLVNYGSVLTYARTSPAGVSVNTMSGNARAWLGTAGFTQLTPALYNGGGAGFMAGSLFTSNLSLVKFSFSTEAFSSLVNSLATFASTCMFSSTYAYYCNGSTKQTLHMMSEAFSTASSSISFYDPKAMSAVAGYSSYSDLTYKFPFATQTWTNLGVSLATRRDNAFGLWSGGAAYFCGGIRFVSPYDKLTSIEKMAFSTETYSTVSAVLSTARYNGTGLSGYATGITAGGQTDSFTFLTTVDGITFSTDTSYTPGSSLSAARASAGGMCSYTNGYLVGGDDTGTNYLTSAVKISLDSASVSAVSEAIPNPAEGRSGNGTVAYYRGGPFGIPDAIAGSGSLVASGTVLSGVQVTLSGAVGMSAIGSLSSQNNPVIVTMVGSGAAVAGAKAVFVGATTMAGAGSVSATVRVRSTAGYAYIAGGAGVTLQRFSYLSETTTLISYSISNGIQYGAGALSTPNYGYFIGGGVETSFSTQINRLVFATDTLNSPIAAALTMGRSWFGVTQSPTKAYFCGGWTGMYTYVHTATAEIDGLVLATEAAHNPSATLASTTEQCSGVWSASYGYLFYRPLSATWDARYQSTDRITFATDVVSAVSAAVASNNRVVSVTAQDTGYLFGGSGYYQQHGARKVQKFTFSTQTLREVAMALAECDSQATTTTDAAYLYYQETCDVFSYATDTTRTAANALADVEYYIDFPAVGSPGFAGWPSEVVPKPGSPGSLVGYGVVSSTIGKGVLENREVLSFNSETFSLSRMLLVPANRTGVGVQNNEFGYFLGGTLQTGWSVLGIVFQTETDRIVSDTLGVGTQYAAGHSSPLAGYTSGGYYDNNGSTRYDRTQKLVFSSETVSMVSDALTTGRVWPVGVQSATRGYIAGGRTGTETQTTMIESIAYSTDSVSTLGATLSVARIQIGGVSSSTRGYFAGGESFSSPNSTYYAEIDGIQFSNNSAINPSAALTVERDECATMSSGTKGYLVGAYSTMGQGDADALTFSTETVAAVSAGTIDTVYPGGCAVSYVPGTAQTHFATAQLSGQGTLSPSNVTMVLRVFPSFSGAGTLAASGTVYAVVKGTASMSGAGSCTTSASVGSQRLATASMAGAGQLLATASSAITTAANCAGAGAVASNATVTRNGSAAFSGSGSMSAAALITMHGSAEMTGIGTMQASGQRGTYGVTTLAGAGTMSVRAFAVLPRGLSFGFPSCHVMLHDDTVVVRNSQAPIHIFEDV